MTLILIFLGILAALELADAERDLAQEMRGLFGVALSIAGLLLHLAFKG